MIFSLKHLNTFLPMIQLDSSVEKVINNIGFEVESISKFSDVKGIRFAHVKKFYKNPNSDNLYVAELKLSEKDIIIQTTDSILKEGDLVVCFPVGSSKGDVVFGEKQMKGIVSQGMMASLSELGYKEDFLGNSVNHLLRLPLDFASLNDDPMSLLGVDDYIIDVSMTSNRNDANSYHILAKELSAYYETKLEFKNPNLQPDYYSKKSVSQGVSEELTLFEIKRKQGILTPLKEQLLLAKHGYVINEDWAVNLTNLCLITTGAPAHVYDSKKIGSKITTSLFSGDVTILGEKIVNLQNALIVNDEFKPISIASVMGLEDTKAELNSDELTFEIGNFSTKKVRESSIQIKLNSESSNQARKTITKSCLINGINFLRNYLKNYGVELSNVLGIPKNIPTKKIQFDERKLRRYSGIKDLKTAFNPVLKKLEKLDFKFIGDEIIVPNYRYDIEFFEDIIEEIFRFYSYKNFKPKQPFAKAFKVNEKNNLDLLASYLGYAETKTYSLISKEKNYFNPFKFEKNISLMTYVSKEREEIRNSIIPSLLEVIIHNKKREINNINIFEKGMINNNVYVYGFASSTKSFLEMKKDIIDFYKNDNLEFKPFKDNEFVHPNYSAKIFENGLFIGWIGKMHPAYDNSDTLVSEILVPNKPSLVKFSEIDYSPLKSIDLTFSIGLRNNIGDIIEKIKSSYDVFEIVQKDIFIKENSKNVTLRITADSETVKNINEEYN